jgi:hypothetical protein
MRRLGGPYLLYPRKAAGGVDGSADGRISCYGVGLVAVPPGIKWVVVEYSSGRVLESNQGKMPEPRETFSAAIRPLLCSVPEVRYFPKARKFWARHGREEARNGGQSRLVAVSQNQALNWANQCFPRWVKVHRQTFAT